MIISLSAAGALSEFVAFSRKTAGKNSAFSSKIGASYRKITHAKFPTHFTTDNLYINLKFNYF